MEMIDKRCSASKTKPPGSGRRRPASTDATRGRANPAGGAVWIELTEEITRVEVQLVNALGQVLLRQTLSSGGGWLPTDQLPAGMYWVALSKEGRMRGVRKLVIK